MFFLFFSYLFVNNCQDFRLSNHTRGSSKLIVYLAVNEATLVVPVADEPRYKPCQVVVASVGAVSDDFTVYVEPFTMPVAVMKVHVLLMATGSWKVTRFWPEASASVL